MTDKPVSELSRRQLLTMVMQVSAVATVSVAAACAKNASVACYDPDKASDSDIQLRSTLNYADASADPKQVCGGCAFFQAAKDGGGCGYCTLLKGPVNPRGHCTSWSAHR